MFTFGAQGFNLTSHTAQLIRVTHRRPKLTFRESEDIIIVFDEVERKPNFVA